MIDGRMKKKEEERNSKIKKNMIIMKDFLPNMLSII